MTQMVTALGHTGRSGSDGAPDGRLGREHLPGAADAQLQSREPSGRGRISGRSDVRQEHLVAVDLYLKIETALKKMKLS